MLRAHRGEQEIRAHMLRRHPGPAHGEIGQFRIPARQLAVGDEAGRIDDDASILDQRLENVGKTAAVGIAGVSGALTHRRMELASSPSM